MDICYKRKYEKIIFFLINNIYKMANIEEQPLGTGAGN